MLYTNKIINLISLVITLVIFSSINSYFIYSKTKIIEDIPNIISKYSEDEKNSNPENEEIVEIGNWYIKIPKINLIAPIAEGTDSETLNTKVGHFEETSLTEGNVGLAGHNRGYKYNYFENLKKLKIDDEIIYKYENYEKKYIIDKIEIIKNTDWSYLEKTDENKITLITCIENEPQYRRCVQATEVEN